MNDSNERMTYRDLRELVELINSCSHFGEFHLKLGDLEVDLKRIDAAAAASPPPAAQVPAAAAPALSAPRHGHVGGGEVVVEPSQAQLAGGAVQASAPAFAPGSVVIKSPMVGTFYRAPEPGAPAFVEIGQVVDADTTVCIIEVMKLMNSIPAASRGTVTHILVGDGDPVEYGQALLVVAPA